MRYSCCKYELLYSCVVNRSLFTCNWPVENNFVTIIFLVSKQPLYIHPMGKRNISTGLRINMIEQEYLWHVYNTWLTLINILSCRVYSEGTDGG